MSHTVAYGGAERETLAGRVPQHGRAGPRCPLMRLDWAAQAIRHTSSSVRTIRKVTTFHSTRSSADALTSKQAIRKGIADDGGLFVTDQLGETTVDISALAGKSYQQIAFDVLSVLLPDFGEDELKQCIAEAYGSQWSDERITPVKPLGDDYVMELFNGPTCAFKDVALQILPRFMARKIGRAHV